MRKAPLRRPSAGVAGTRLELYDVDRLGSLVALLSVVGDLRSLGEGAVAVTRDAAEVDEQVAIAVIGRDEPEALLVAEPLDRSGCHACTSTPVCATCAEGCCPATTCGTCTAL